MQTPTDPTHTLRMAAYPPVERREALTDRRNEERRALSPERRQAERRALRSLLRL